jgi:hypothetical protein
MKTICLKITIFSLLIFYIAIVILISCKKVEEVNQDPEIEPLKQGFKVSAAVGYCASLANTLFRGEDLPDNVLFQSTGNDEYSGSGIMYVTINNSYPLPFNSNIGQIIIACLWDVSDYSGVITAIFTDIDILEEKYEFRGIHTIPVIEMEDGNILTLFAEQDIIIGEGSDTLLNLNLTNPQFNLEMDRLDTEQLNDAFVAVNQNVWFININQNNTMSDIYDDEFTINGGGQIVEYTSVSSGILYHAMIGAKFIHNTCEINPIEGIGFIQNFKAGTKLDLGHIFLNFHDKCDGKAYVELATGKYLTSNHRNVNLNFY